MNVFKCDKCGKEVDALGVSQQEYPLAGNYSFCHEHAYNLASVIIQWVDDPTKH